LLLVYPLLPVASRAEHQMTASRQAVLWCSWRYCVFIIIMIATATSISAPLHRGAPHTPSSFSVEHDIGRTTTSREGTVTLFLKGFSHALIFAFFSHYSASDPTRSRLILLGKTAGKSLASDVLFASPSSLSPIFSFYPSLLSLGGYEIPFGYLQRSMSGWSIGAYQETCI